MQKKEILLLIPLLVIVITLIIGISILIEEPLDMISEEFCGCHEVVPSYLFLFLCTLLILATIPISYYFSSKKMDEKMEKQISILSGIINRERKLPEDGPINKKSILKFFSDNERRVLRRLLESEGTVLQSEISRMNGMTKLKAHRIVKDMEKKGIVTIERHGKTNRIFLNDEFKSLKV